MARRCSHLVLVALAACGDKEPPQHPTPITSVTVAADAMPPPKLKIMLAVPNPVPCPAIPPPSGDPQRLAATGAHAGLVIDIDRYLQADYGVPEAVALLGPPALCNGHPDSGFMELHLAPLSPDVRAATLETHDGDLIGIVLEFEAPVAADVPALARRHGSLRAMPRLHGPRGDAIDTETTDYRGQLLFSYAADGTRVQRIIYRRSAMLEILPDKFQSAADLVRLVKLALRPRAPDTVKFYGTLGVFAGITGDTVSFQPAIQLRNVARASITKRSSGNRHFVHAMTVTFATPIATDAAKLGSALGARVAGTTLQLASGTVRVDTGTAGITTIEIERLP